MSENAELHKKAQVNNEWSKERNRVEFDQRMKTQECKFRVGDKALLAREQTNKAISKWDPDPFTVVFMNGLMTGERAYPKFQVVTRNSSFTIFSDMNSMEAFKQSKRQDHLSRTSK